MSLPEYLDATHPDIRKEPYWAFHRAIDYYTNFETYDKAQIMTLLHILGHLTLQGAPKDGEF